MLQISLIIMEVPQILLTVKDGHEIPNRGDNRTTTASVKLMLFPFITNQI